MYIHKSLFHRDTHSTITHLWGASISSTDCVVLIGSNEKLDPVSFSWTRRFSESGLYSILTSEINFEGGVSCEKQVLPRVSVSP